MPELKTPTRDSMSRAVHAFAELRPDAKALLEAERDEAAALYDAHKTEPAPNEHRTAGMIAAAAARRRTSDWIARLMDDPAANVEDAREGKVADLEAWAGTHGPESAAKAVNRLESSAAAESEHADLLAGELRAESAHATRDPLSPADAKASILAAARKMDEHAEAVAKADASKAAAAAIRGKLAALFGAEAKANRAALEAAFREVVAMGRPLDQCARMKSLRARRAEVAAELERLQALGGKPGPIAEEAAAELKELDKSIADRTKEIAATSTAEAKAVLDGCASGDPESVSALMRWAKENPRSFGDAYGRFLALAGESIQAGGPAAAAVLLPS